MTKIAINMNADELNRFIGEDSDAALELKNKMVQEFAKRHLKALVTDDMIKIGEAAKRQAWQIAADAIGSVRESYLHETMHVRLSSDAKAEIEHLARKQADAAIQNEAGPLIERAVAGAVAELSREVARRVENRLYADLKSKVFIEAVNNLRVALGQAPADGGGIRIVVVRPQILSLCSGYGGLGVVSLQAAYAFCTLFANTRGYK